MVQFQPVAAVAAQGESGISLSLGSSSSELDSLSGSRLSWFFGGEVV